MKRNYSYVSVALKPEYVKDVFAHLLEAGIAPASKHDLHCTVIYDERTHEKPLCKLDPNREFTANITKLEVLGDGVVFHMTSRDINEEFRRLTDAGYQHSFDTPLPHMSLAYDCDQYDKLAIEAAFSNWAGRQLVFHRADFGYGTGD